MVLIPSVFPPVACLWIPNSTYSACPPFFSNINTSLSTWLFLFIAKHASISPVSKIFTLTFKSPFSYLFISVFPFSAKLLSRVVYSTTSSIQCNMVSAPLTPLNVLSSNSLVASKLQNPDAPVSAHLTSHHHFTLLIAFSWSKFWGKDLSTFRPLKFEESVHSRNQRAVAFVEYKWSHLGWMCGVRRGKGLNPRGQAEAGRSTKEPGKWWLLGQEMPRTEKPRQKRVINRKQTPERWAM